MEYIATYNNKHNLDPSINPNKGIYNGFFFGNLILNVTEAKEIEEIEYYKTFHGHVNGVELQGEENSTIEIFRRNMEKHCDQVIIGHGFTAHISKDKLIGYSYVACSGNFVGIEIGEKESTLYVQSRRHGIPPIGNTFAHLRAIKVLKYKSFRTDAEWWKTNLTKEKPVNEGIGWKLTKA